MPPSLRLHYLGSSDLDDPASHEAADILGVIGFGAGRPAIATGNCPFAKVDMAPLAAGLADYEIWSADGPVAYEDLNGIGCARNDDILFGAMQLADAERGDFESLTYDGYIRLFDTVDRTGYNHLLRIWNYLPGITHDDGGEQRYRRFSQGRHDAFAARRRPVETAPAASAIGCQSGPTTIYFLAARDAAKPIENPRQVSAYRYPPEYGPRSPTFSRATLSQVSGETILFVSGTASVVGHESVHPGDPVAQLRETFVNLRTVMAEANKDGSQPGLQSLALKVYVRHREHLQIVREGVDELLRRGETAIYLNADICRPELLLEIEAVAIGGTCL